MKKLTTVLLVLSLTSCNHFNVKKISSESILSEELKTFNWKDVDEYPSFASCDSTFENEARKQCFTQTLVGTITEQLAHKHVEVSEHVTDTVLMRFQILHTGELKVLNVKASALTYKEIPNIDSLLIGALDSLPKIYPAVKRSQQVTTEFDLPVVIHVD
ncbi:hypothetical protein IA57_07080 [Mangrovimonas yunxiaonensis]|uniref:TonB C-terminal domain-containing protein n=1 Tax=Mangrovimonas yunxiaonensis TaxID=1197477 RepID=A0A084TLJ9_9FLAO|nr:hypothetical protein [Mangrovimonas yunxiaonensis]KFB01585.1 hypothetical protein IA57_07080 [Mangrovimonas yunxiaonensis]GGH35813.1 hypothetical protein GCM10011364_02630 [Mangrovimonas yunxiaonensis]